MATFAKTIQRTICSKPINPCSLEFQPWSLLIDNQYLNAIRPFPFLFLNPRPFLFLRFVPSVQLVPTKLPSFLFPPGHTATFFPRSEGEKRSFVVACTKDLFAADATRADNINVGNTEGKEKAREKEREREKEEVERIERERPWFDLSRATTCLCPWRRTSGTRDVLFASEDGCRCRCVADARRYRSTIRLGMLTTANSYT